MKQSKVPMLSASSQKQREARREGSLKATEETAKKG